MRFPSRQYFRRVILTNSSFAYCGKGWFTNTPMDGNKHNNGNGNKDVFEEWTKNEKFELLQALKVYGSHNVESIQSLFPNKSIEEIEIVIHHYKDKALHHPMLHKQKKEKTIVNSFSRVPLVVWAKYLMESFQYNELQTETATALRLIAEFEDIPSHFLTNDVDFRQIYHALANAFEGKTLPDDPNLNALLQKCIVDTAYASKYFIRIGALRDFIESIDLKDKDGCVFHRASDSDELLAVRHLARQRNYNPLNVPEEYLKPESLNKKPAHPS